MHAARHGTAAQVLVGTSKHLQSILGLSYPQADRMEVVFLRIGDQDWVRGAVGAQKKQKISKNELNTDEEQQRRLRYSNVEVKTDGIMMKGSS